ncbi:protein-ER retention protein [Thoreauomyces humboldtii]|nr:protein-ER retention protein [Thoreauomyces humboldtii]
MLRPALLRAFLFFATIGTLYLSFHSSQYLFTRFLSLPPYFRFLLLVDLGVWCFATNLHGLALCGINVSRLLDDGTHQGERRREGRGGYRAVYGIAAVLSAVTAGSVILFMSLEQRWGEERAEVVPALTYIVMVGLVCWPWDGFYARERATFLRSLVRTLTGGLSSPVPFCDVIFADILTSFAKVMGDLKIVFADLVTIDEEAVSAANMAASRLLAHPAAPMTISALDLVSPLLVCIPFLLRLRQCLSEYTQTPKAAIRRRHLANSLKYISALPVVISGFMINWMESAYHRRYPAGVDFDANDHAHSRELASAQRGIDIALALWILFSAVNSLFSLYWDVVMDWHLGTSRANAPSASSLNPRGLTINTGTSTYTSKPYPLLLRPHRHFHPAAVYYIAVAVDVGLRMSWIVRMVLLKQVVGDLSTHPSTTTVEALVACDVGLKVLEILRRWMWVFLRVEREWVTKPSYSARGATTGGSGDAMSPLMDSAPMNYDSPLSAVPIIKMEGNEAR